MTTPEDTPLTVGPFKFSMCDAWDDLAVHFDGNSPRIELQLFKHDDDGGRIRQFAVGTVHGDADHSALSRQFHARLLHAN